MFESSSKELHIDVVELLIDVQKLHVDVVKFHSDVLTRFNKLIFQNSIVLIQYIFLKFIFMF